MVRFSHVSTLVLLACASSAALAAPPFAMNDQVRTQVRALRGITLSPDGRQVLAGITDTTEKGGTPHLWRLAPDAAPRQLTFSHSGDTGGETSGVWSPDGRSVLFLAKREGTRSLFRLALDGGEPVRLQFAKKEGGVATAAWDNAKGEAALNVGGFAVAPDGRSIAIWADDAEPAATKARGERKDDAYVQGEDKDRTRLYLVDPVTAAVRAVPLAGKFATARWSQGSADLLVGTDPDRDEIGPDTSIWRIDARSLATRRLDVPRTVGIVADLPGRRAIAYTAACTQDAPPGCNDLFVKDLASGETRNLTQTLDGELPDDFIVTPAGDIVTTIPVHTHQRLARISTRTGAIAFIDGASPVVGGLATNAAQSGWAMVASGPAMPSTILLASTLEAKPTALAIPALVPADWAKVPSKLVTWQNEGQTIEGLLYLPATARGRKVPLVVGIHGGPASHYADGYSNQVQMLVAEGWAVLLPNPRGSTGYGARFLAANRNDLGGADYRDIMAGVDTVLRDYPLDPDRMALIGYSYGGEMAGFVLGRTMRFKAIVSGAPVTDQFSEYGTENGSFYDRWYYGRPWDNFADAWRQSPISLARNAKTPFLLLQGEADTTDPLGQSREMYVALQQYGAPVAMIVYPREDHGALGSNFAGGVSTEPWHGVDVRRRMFGFLRAAFAGEADPLAAARADTPAADGRGSLTRQ